MGKKSLFKKATAFAIITLFIAASILPTISGNNIESNEKLTIESKKHVKTQEDVVVTCYTFGMLGEPSKEIELPLNEAEYLLDKIKELNFEVASDPLSEEIQQLQDEIVDLADGYGLLPTGLSKSKVKECLVHSFTPQTNRKGILPLPQNKASEFLCTFVSTGYGGVLPIIALPRLIPILMIPIPRLFMRWKAQEAMTSCGGLRSGTGFIAYGQQKGVALGFWGLGFTFSLPPFMGVYGLVGYALFATVDADEIVFYPPNSPPVISQIDPYDGEINVPLSLSELRFQIFDYDGDLMSYTVTTTPDIGSGSGNLKPDGVYSVPISGLEDLTEYSWHIEVTDGMDTTVDDFIFTTEAVAPIVSNPSPDDNERNVPVDLFQLSFHLKDFQGDPMDYTVETSPDIGSGSGTGVGEGTYSVEVNNLNNNTVYTWYVNVTDGYHWTRKQFVFETIYPTFFDPFELGWQYRKEITISPDNIDSDLTNFPVLISSSDSDLRDKAQLDGDDILFMDDRGVARRLSHQIEQFESASGTLIAWINLTTVFSSYDTNFYLYYGNSNCLNKEYIEGTWDSHYVSIWHMNDLTPSTVDDSIDSAHYGIKRDDYEPVESDGKIFKAQQFDGNNDYISISNLEDYAQYSQGTFEMWFKWRPGGSSIGGLFSYSGDYNQGHDNYIDLCVGDRTSGFEDESMAIEFKTLGTTEYFGYYRGGSSLYHDDTWHYVALAVGSDYNKLFVDGEELIFDYTHGNGYVGNYFLNIDDTDYFYIGAVEISDGFRWFFNCDLDETRISEIPRSPAWISTSYNNQNDPSSFIEVGPEEPVP